MPADVTEIQQHFKQWHYRFTVHALERMLERDIDILEVEFAVGHDVPEVIEDYPDDPRGPSCLILGWTRDGRALHVQIGYTYMREVITAYEPDEAQWIDLRQRRRRQ